MKTQISFKKIDGSDGVALVDGDTSGVLQAKRALAHQLGLPREDDPPGQSEDIDARLRNGGIDPQSVKGTHISE